MGDKRQQSCPKQQQQKNWQEIGTTHLKDISHVVFVGLSFNVHSSGSRNSLNETKQKKIMEKRGDRRSSYLGPMKLDSIEENVSELGCRGQVHDCSKLCPVDGVFMCTAQTNLWKQRPPGATGKHLSTTVMLRGRQFSPFFKKLSKLVATL